MNDKIRNIESTLLSDNWYRLHKYRFDYQGPDGQWQTQEREAYDRGNGATILLYNPVKKTVILTRQFRLPTYINGNDDGMLIESCAGLLDQDNAEDCIRREAEEETGYRIEQVQKVFEAYMSPGSVTELVYFFIARYSESMKVSEGGGLAHEQENIEVLEIPISSALAMIDSGDIRDGKTIMLLQYLQLKGML
ncbi:GDP-mannose pyrophosphatase NudK [Saccharospirillum sp. HFRX-1]|uniref:GDP-mannose pyrophosphatase NudK n=1 Tax=unclassified Saccharospirillum TaxID=2633430 RepID=UPI0037199280